MTAPTQGGYESQSTYELPTQATPCPCCGSYVESTLGVASPLLAVCDVLVVRALEAVGKRVVRAPKSRGRHAQLGNRPWHEAHTIWQPDEHLVVKTLANAWDVVPALIDTHGCCGATSRQVTRMLDQYVRDLLITGTSHDVDELRYRFETRLGIPTLE